MICKVIITGTWFIVVCMSVYVLDDVMVHITVLTVNAVGEVIWQRSFVM